MHDYKFRQSDRSLNKPKHNLYKKVLGISAFAVAAASVYGIVQLGFSQQAQSNAPEADPDIIPLALPPHIEPEESGQPADSNQSRPAEIPSDRAFTNAMKPLNGQGATASVATSDETWIEKENFSASPNRCWLSELSGRQTPCWRTRAGTQTQKT